MLVGARRWLLKKVAKMYEKDVLKGEYGPMAQKTLQFLLKNRIVIGGLLAAVAGALTQIEGDPELVQSLDSWANKLLALAAGLGFSAVPSNKTVRQVETKRIEG